MIALLLAAAVALFVLSLPLAQTSFGGTLRRAAAVCFLLALLPSILVRRDLLPWHHRERAPEKTLPVGWRLLGKAAHLRWHRELRPLAWKVV